MARAWAMVVAFGMGCSGSDSGTVDAATNVCVPLRDAWIVDYGKLSKSCVVKEDCSLVGGGGTFQTCNGVIYVGPQCGGAPVNKAAYQASDLGARATSWVSRCGSTCAASGVPCAADCGPSTVDCVQGVCRDTPRSCLPPPPDAGPRDASP